MNNITFQLGIEFGMASGVGFCLALFCLSFTFGIVRDLLPFLFKKHFSNFEQRDI